MASAVAKRSDHRVSRSASWSVMHSDEDLARVLQMQEEKEYQDHLAAKAVQCQSDHQLARFLAEEYDGHPEGAPTNTNKSRNARHPPTRRHTASNSPSANTSSPNATVISITDSDTDFSDCFEDSTFDELSSAVERARDESERAAERQDVADALARDEEIAEALQNDEQLNRMIENELESPGLIGGAGNAFGASRSSVGNSSPICSDSEVLNHRNETMEFSPVGVGNSEVWTGSDESGFAHGTSPGNNALLSSVNIAWNVVGSAVHWVSELFSGAQPSPPQSNVDNRVTVCAEVDAEEEDDDEEEEEGCEEDDGWEEEESDDFGDFDDDDFDDDEADYDMMDSDMDEDSDEENSEVVFVRDNGIVGRGRGLALEEIDVLPTCRFQSRPPQTTTAATRGAANAGANEHQCQNECQVCLSGFTDGEVLRTLPCCHQFHSECIDVWLQRNAICPVCRVRIRDEIGCR